MRATHDYAGLADELERRAKYGVGAGYKLSRFVWANLSAIVAALREAGRMREILAKIEPLASQLNSAAEINTEWGRVVVGQAQAARDLYEIVAALEAAR